MAASVRIEDEAFSDVRIAALGDLAGYNHFEALGRMAHLWRLCTQRGIYIVSEVLVASCLGRNGAEALVGAELGERVEGGIRIKGTDGRIEWLEEKRATSTAGGKVRAATAIRVGGRFAKTVPHQPAGETLVATTPIVVAPVEQSTSTTSATSTPPALAGGAGPAGTSTPPALSSAPAHERYGSKPGGLEIREIAEIGFAKCRQLGGTGEAAIRSLMPISRDELEAALRTDGTSWKYIARVIESARSESARPRAPPYRGRRNDEPAPSGRSGTWKRLDGKQEP